MILSLDRYDWSPKLARTSRSAFSFFFLHVRGSEKLQAGFRFCESRFQIMLVALSKFCSTPRAAHLLTKVKTLSLQKKNSVWPWWRWKRFPLYWYAAVLWRSWWVLSPRSNGEYEEKIHHHKNNEHSKSTRKRKQTSNQHPEALRTAS